MKSAILSEKMNKKSVYVDAKNMLRLEKDVINHINKIDTSFEKISGLLNKAVYKRNIKGDATSTFVDLSKKCLAQSEYSKKLSSNFESKIDSDLTKYNLAGLDERLKELERKIAILLKDE